MPLLFSYKKSQNKCALEEASYNKRPVPETAKFENILIQMHKVKLKFYERIVPGKRPINEEPPGWQSLTKRPTKILTKEVKNKRAELCGPQKRSTQIECKNEKVLSNVESCILLKRFQNRVFYCMILLKTKVFLVI